MHRIQECLGNLATLFVAGAFRRLEIRFYLVLFDWRGDRSAFRVRSEAAEA